MRRRYAYFAVAIMAILAVTYPVIFSVYAGNSSGPSGFTCPPLLPCDNSQPVGANCTTFCVVDIQDSAFSPASINVTKGTTVEWVNLDPNAHTSTAFTPGGWSSPIIPPGGHYFFTFSNITVGTYYYQCKIHPFMIGQVNVLPANSA